MGRLVAVTAVSGGVPATAGLREGNKRALELRGGAAMLKRVATRGLVGRSRGLHGGAARQHARSRVAARRGEVWRAGEGGLGRGSGALNSVGSVAKARHCRWGRTERRAGGQGTIGGGAIGGGGRRLCRRARGHWAGKTERVEAILPRGAIGRAGRRDILSWPAFGRRRRWPVPGRCGRARHWVVKMLGRREDRVGVGLGSWAGELFGLGRGLAGGEVLVKVRHGASGMRDVAARARSGAGSSRGAGKRSGSRGAIQNLSF